MDISPDFLEISSSINFNKIELIPQEDLIRLKIVTGGVTSVTWSIQTEANTFYVRGERDSLYGHHKMIFGFLKGFGFFLSAVIESQGREWELTSFPLVELVIGCDEEVVIDITSRCSIIVKNMYTIIDVIMDHEEAGLVAESNGFGIRIRGGPDAGVFLGISPMPTEGGRHMLATMLHNFA